MLTAVEGGISFPLQAWTGFACGDEGTDERKLPNPYTKLYSKIRLGSYTPLWISICV